MELKPPKYIDRLLQWYCIQTDLEDIQGDFYEVYEERAEHSRFKANLLFTLDTLNLFNPFSKQRKRHTWISESYNFNFKNQVKRTFRNAKRFPFVNALKIGGLAVAFCAFLFISDYTRFHNTFDHFHPKKDRIYRVVTTVTSPDISDATAWSHAYLRDIVDEFPQVEEIVRLLKVEEALIAESNNRIIKESEVFFADPEIGRLFGYEWLEGNPTTALLNPGSVVITKAVALKYFNSASDIVGKTILLDKEPFNITGVVANVPANSDFKFNMLIPFDYSDLEEWMFVYLLFEPNTSMEDFKALFTDVLADYNDHYTDQGVELAYDFENIADVHFSEPKLYDTPKVSRDRIVLFRVIGWTILLIAGANYLNLYTALLLRRIRSVNVQVVVGASKKQLLLEFTTETGLLIGIGALLGIILTTSISNLVSTATGFTFFSIGLSWWQLFYFLLGFSVIVFAIACYALIVTTKQSHSQLFELKPIKAPFRRALIGFQFGLSFAIIVGTIVIFEQTRHLLNQPLGFNMDRTIHFQFPDYLSQSDIETIKQEMLQLNFVRSIAQLESNAAPGMDPWLQECYVPSAQQEVILEELSVDHAYANTLDLKVVSGEFFSKEKHRPYRALVVNRALTEHFGWNEKTALGKKLNFYGHNASIIGVVENFYFNSPHELVKPMVLNYSTMGPFALLKLNENVAASEAIRQIEIVWNGQLPSFPFNFSFLKSDYEIQFKEEQAALNVLAIIASLVVSLSLLGMYGILLMHAKSREKELGIRKVTGATLIDLFKLFTKDFTKILIIAILLSTPLIWIGLSDWLSQYPIRVAINPAYLIGAAGLIVAAASGLIYLQAHKSYQSNTVEALKYE